ncbi:MAG: hypothetical protein DIU82_09120 [Bacillota bacterium]|nr:MAG: hypothetical protein DIU82_09120 [Bacillota bacterium]
MSIDAYRSAVQRHQKEIARLQQEKSRELAQVADALRRSRSAEEVATKTQSDSTRHSKLREAQRYQEEAIRHQRRVAEIEDRLAQEQRRLQEAEERLARAQAQEEQRRLREQERAAREYERQMAAIRDTLARHDRLYSVALAAMERLQHLPDMITILFLAANPLDQGQLRLDEEVRAISEMIRKGKYRDVIRLESRWALRPLDLLQAINECRPTVIHFSGHGSESGHIVFQDDAGRSKLVSTEAVVQTLAAASDTIQLVFFNTCYSREQAEAVVKYIPAAIGMNVSIRDDAARVFAAQFYSSLSFGLSLSQAFEQAKAALMLEGIPEEDVPALFVAAGLNVDDLVLVAPPDRLPESR